MRRIDVARDERIECQPGPAPMLQWIEIKDLVVDETYQRDLSPRNWKAIRAIAGDFRWSRFSPVFCAPVEGGAFAIIDGQHRTHAAALCGFKSVPCQVVQMSIDEQATAFGAVNGAVTAITVWNLFRAEIASGDPAAVALVKMAEAAGCKVATGAVSHKQKKPGFIYFIQGIKELHAKHGDTLGVALATVRNTYPWSENVDAWGGHILEPVLIGLCERPATIRHPRFPQALADFDLYTEIDRIAEMRRARIRAGLVIAAGKELLRMALVEHLDKCLPQKVAVRA